MIYIIIRTCKRDDYLAKLCYDSFKNANVEGTYIFIADEDEYDHITTTGESIIFKNRSDNYGGQFGVKALLNSLKQFNFSDDDTIIISDSDIIVFNNFINQIGDSDHCGVGGRVNGVLHISGQMQIFNGKTINRLINLSINEIDNVVRDMIFKNINVADDTFNSYMTDRWGCRKNILSDKNWIHYKAYDYINNNTLDVINLFKEKLK